MKCLLVKCIETFLIYIYLFIKVLNDVIVVNFLSLKVHFTLKNLIFYMDFFINHMVRIIHRLAY